MHYFQPEYGASIFLQNIGNIKLRPTILIRLYKLYFSISLPVAWLFIEYDRVQQRKWDFPCWLFLCISSGQDFLRTSCYDINWNKALLQQQFRVLNSSAGFISWCSHQSLPKPFSAIQHRYKILSFTFWFVYNLTFTVQYTQLQW